MVLPKKIFFYWGDDPMSFLRVMSPISFKINNPDWDVILIKNDNTSLDFGNDKNYKGEDYFKLLKKYKINIENITKNHLEVSKLKVTEVHRADILKWHCLATRGGIVCDMDILYFKPFDYEYFKDVDVGFISFKGNPKKGYIPVSFILGTKNVFFKDVYKNIQTSISKSSCSNKKNKDDVDYEAYGTNLITENYGSLENIKEQFDKLNVVKLPSQIVFPFADTKLRWGKYFNLMFKKDLTMPDKSLLGKVFRRPTIPNNCIGIHWYAGAKKARKYNMEIDLNNYYDYNNTICSLARQTIRKAKIKKERVSIFNCVSTALDMLKFSSESLIKNAGCNDYDYIVVTWLATREVKDYLKRLKQKYDNVYVTEYKTNDEIGYVPNLRAMISHGFEYGYKLNNYCGLVNTDMYFGKDWLKNMVKYMNEDEIVNSAQISAIKGPNFIISINLGVPTYKTFNLAKFNQLYEQEYKDIIEDETQRGSRRATNTMPYLIHKKYWKQCGPWKTDMSGRTPPDVQFFECCRKAGARCTMSKSSIVYHHEAVERKRPRPKGAEHLNDNR